MAFFFQVGFTTTESKKLPTCSRSETSSWGYWCTVLQLHHSELFTIKHLHCSSVLHQDQLCCSAAVDTPPRPSGRPKQEISHNVSPKHPFLLIIPALGFGQFHIFAGRLFQILHFIKSKSLFSRCVNYWAVIGKQAAHSLKVNVYLSNDVPLSAFSLTLRLCKFKLCRK